MAGAAQGPARRPVPLPALGLRHGGPGHVHVRATTPRCSRPATRSTCRPATRRRGRGDGVRAVQPGRADGRGQRGDRAQPGGDAVRLTHRVLTPGRAPRRRGARAGWRRARRPCASRRRSWCRCARRGWPPSCGEITSRAAISLLVRPRASSRRTSISRAVSPAGPVRRRDVRWPAAASTASTASASSRPARTSVAQPGGGRPRRTRLAVRARLAHRLVGVGRGQHPRGAGDRGAGQAARVAGPVEPLAVLHGDRPERARAPVTAAASARSGTAPSGSARARPRRAASACRGSRSTPRACRSSARGRRGERADLGRRQPELGRGVRGEVGDGAGVPERVRRLQVDEVGDRQQRRVELVADSTTASAGSAPITASQVSAVSSPDSSISAWASNSSARSGSNCLPRCWRDAAPWPPRRRRRGAPPR